MCATIVCDKPFKSTTLNLSKNDFSFKGNNYLNKFQIRNGVDFVSQHVARNHNKRDLAIYKIAIRKWLNKNKINNIALTL
jgi:hypothetical protein